MDLLSNGPLYTLVQNVIYALPAVKSTLFTDTATPTIQVSNSPTFATNAAVTLVAGSATVVGGFIRSTAGNAVVNLARD